MRTEEIRAEVQNMIRQAPFRPFALMMENGDRIIIDHPENIAFDPTSDTRSGSKEFYVLSNQLRLFSTFEAVTSVAIVDRGETAQEND